MLAAPRWSEAVGAEFGWEQGEVGFAHLRRYTAEYREWGQGPPLVLVPGLAGGIGLLGPLARCLADKYRVIAYQLRGEDDCFALRQRFSLADVATDLAEFIDHRGLERPAVFGVSFGGIVALECAVRHPGRIGAVITQGTGARLESGFLEQIAQAVLSRYPLPSDNAFVNQFFNLLFGKRQPAGALFEFVTRQCWQTDQGVMAHRFSMCRRFVTRGRLKAVTTPALIMAGDRDLLVSKRSIHELVEEMGTAKAVTLPGCGHLAFVSAPALVAQEVKCFLRDLVKA